MARISLSHLFKSFGSTAVVADFALEVNQGEFVALLGPSGCGKTTVVRMIAGITPVDEGHIDIGGKQVEHLPPERRNIGLVFQSYALFPHMTVEANVAFGLQMRKIGRDEIARRVAEALALVDLTTYANRHPKALSGGQQQRVALARALVVEPDVLLLDEPLSNLDARLRDQLREDIRALQRRLGITTIYVTHDQSEALSMADTVVVMDRGRIIEQGDPRTLYQTPRNHFTARFLGHTNIVTADSLGDAIIFPWGQRRDDWTGPLGPVQLSVRPEDIVIRPHESGWAIVTDVTFLGSEIEHKIGVHGTTLRVRTSGSHSQSLPVGARVELVLPAQLHLLTGHVSS